jgi:hypothetical protein
MMKCGCRVLQGSDPSSGRETPPEISFCPMHGHALEMLKLLGELDKAGTAPLSLEARARLRALLWEITPVSAAHPAPGFVYTRGGKRRGLVTGGVRACGARDCAGPLIGVRWPDGKMTWPCRQGMFERPDGNMEIHVAGSEVHA